MSHKKASTKAVAPEEQRRPTPWDIVNVFGYALGVRKNVLDYTSRHDSHYNYAYCNGRKALRELREACLLRQALMENFDKLQESIRQRGKLYLPQQLTNGMPRALYNAMRVSTSVEDALCKVQFSITELLPTFELELPCTHVLSTMISARFSLGWAQSGKPLEQWCHDTVTALQGTPYFYQWDKFSARFLRDDRDLVEELYTFYGRDPGEYKFPYPRYKSNRRIHIERLQAFCENNAPVVVELDTENLTPLPTVAFLKTLDKCAPGSIKCINVYADDNVSKTWVHLSEFITSPVHVKKIQRIRSRKSVMDTAIIASVMEVKYSKSAGGVLVVSSDSDFLMLSQQLPDFPICYCCFRHAVSTTALEYLKEHSLPTVYIDYVVNRCIVKQVEQECVDAHLTSVLQQSLPNLKEVLAPAIKEMYRSNPKDSCEDILCKSIQGISLSVREDGTIVVSINDESVE